MLTWIVEVLHQPVFDLRCRQVRLLLKAFFHKLIITCQLLGKVSGAGDPVSGHRDFGFTINADGSYSFYTRGVDRLTTSDGTKAQEYLSLPFSSADALWTSFQSIIDTFVNQNGGNSSIGAQQIHRPDWQAVKDVIDGKAPLSTLSNDCPD